MKIGSIGAGKVAQAVARSAIAAGHEMVLSSRGGPERLAATIEALGPRSSAATVKDAARADVVLLTVPWLQVAASLAGLDPWNGRILVDTTNPFTQVEPALVLADLGDQSASQIVASHAPGARVVKAFNSITMTKYELGPRKDDARRVLFVSGDDADAKGTVKTLIESFGFATVDLGGLLIGGRLQQAGGPLAGRDILVASS